MSTIKMISTACRNWLRREQIPITNCRSQQTRIYLPKTIWYEFLYLQHISICTFCIFCLKWIFLTVPLHYINLKNMVETLPYLWILLNSMAFHIHLYHRICSTVTEFYAPYTSVLALLLPSTLFDTVMHKKYLLNKLGVSKFLQLLFPLSFILPFP